ncbi:MAG: GDSL-type esterase/lipase family protein [Akkermansia sp.]
MRYSGYFMNFKVLFLTCLLSPLTLPVSVCATACVVSEARAIDTAAESQWQGMKRLDFKVADRPCLLIVPDKALPGNPWIWRTEFFDAFPAADIELAKRGFHVGYMNMEDMYGSPQAMKLMDAYYTHVKKEYKLSAKPILEGFSRGGLYAFNWAALRPQCVTALYVDAPVCDFKSWPGGKGKGAGSPSDWTKLCQIYGFTPEKAMKFKKNPIDNLAPLAKAKIPILAVVGDDDNVVPVAENTAIVEERYRKMGGNIKVIHKPGINHHPHSLENPAAIVNFALKATGNKAPQRVVCIGDSITFGVGAGPEERWTNRLQKALGDTYQVFNLGISATTLLNNGDGAYQKRPNYQIAQQIEGDIILIALGTNDSKPQNWAHANEFAKDYQEMIKELRLNNPKAKIYCVLPIPAYPENYGIRDSIIKGEINPLMMKIAKENKCEIIDLYQPMVGKSNLVPDKVHPNGQGHEIMAKVIYKALTGKKMPKD